MGKVKKADTPKVDTKEILKKAIELRPGGSVKDWVETANKILGDKLPGSFVYDEKLGKIVYKN